MEISNLKKRVDPFLEDEEGAKRGYVHIRIQQRTGRKTVTTVQGIVQVDEKKDLKEIVRDLKRQLNCSGTIVSHREYGEVVQLSGDQRDAVKEFLIEKGIVLKDNCILHGF